MYFFQMLLNINCIDSQIGILGFFLSTFYKVSEITGILTIDLASNGISFGAKSIEKVYLQSKINLI